VSHHHGIDRLRAERLLAGQDRVADPVGRLLAAARGPTRPSELHRQAEALGAFRGSRGSVPRTPRRLVPRRRQWGTPFWVKAAALALALTSAGVALAAGTGVLPSPGFGGRPAVSIGPPPSRVPPTQSPSTTATAVPTPPGNGSGSEHGPGSAQPDRDTLVKLCRAYESHGERNPNANANLGTGFADLVAAAGGLDRVATFCAELLASPSPSSSSTVDGLQAQRR
jgi:hypothetical protein